MTRFLRTLLALVVSVALLVQTGTTMTLYMCSMSGSVGPACCCEPDPESAPTIKAAGRDGCCDLIVVSSDAAETSFDVSPPDTSDVAVAAAPSGWEWPDARRERKRASSACPRGPPALGPPPYIENCSFLI